MQRPHFSQSMLRTVVGAILLSLAWSGITLAQAQAQAPAPAPAQMPGARRAAVQPAQSYLGNQRPDPRVFLSPPPTADSPVGKAELQIFHDTRVLKGSARWEMAVRDASLDNVSMFKAYSCALGADINPVTAPAIGLLIRRVLADVSPIVGQQKDHYARPRPFVAAAGETCVDSDNLRNSGSYPSGHSALGWSWALVLAALDPDRAAQIVARGRAFAESRIVCGFHYPSDIAGGQLVTMAVMTALQTNADFVADRDKARTELNSLLSTSPKPGAGQCAAEATLTGTTPW